MEKILGFRNMQEKLEKLFVYLLGKLADNQHNINFFAYFALQRAESIE